MHLVRVSDAAIFTIPFVLIFTLRGCGHVKEPAFRRVPFDLFRMPKREVGEPDFTEHCLLKRRRDECVQLTVPTCQRSKEDSDRFVVELVCEDDFSAMLNDRLVIPCMNGTSYFEIIDQTADSGEIIFLLIKANLSVS